MLQNNIIGVLGRKGGGKSHLVKHWLSQELFGRYIILDSQNEYKQFGVEIYGVETLRSYILQNGTTNFKICYKIQTTQEQEELFYLLNNINSYTLIAEEINLFCNPYQIDESLRNFISFGRHKERSIVYLTRRPAEINRILTSQSDLIIVSGSFHDSADLKYFNNLTFDKDIQQLQQYEKSFHGDSTLLQQYPLI